jgi:ADP-ribose pyrophosphatase
VKPIKTEIAFHTPWFDLLAKTMKEGEAPYYSLRMADYVTIVAITEDRRILAVQQYRPAVEQYTLELPSGLVDPGETPVETARRELLEETGYECGEIESLGSMMPDNGRLGNRLWTCFTSGVRPAPGREPEDGMKVLTYAPAELKRMIVDGEFDHGLNIAVLMVAMLRGKF